MKKPRYTLKLSDAATIKEMGEPVYFVKEWNEGLNVEWTPGILCATTFETRAAVEAFKKRFPHIGGRIVIHSRCG